MTSFDVHIVPKDDSKIKNQKSGNHRSLITNLEVGVLLIFIYLFDVSFKTICSDFNIFAEH